MARLPYLDLDDPDPAVQEAYRVWGTTHSGTVPNAARILAHAPEYVLAFKPLQNQLFFSGEPRLGYRRFAMVSLRTVHLNRCRHCVVHQITRRATVYLSEPEVEALLDDPQDSSLFDDNEKLLLRFAEEVVLNVEPELATFAAVRQLLPPDQMVELAMLIGNWCMFNRIAEIFKIDPEEEYTDLVDHFLGSLPAAEPSV